ncbi:MAG: hypothetical protein AAGG75_27640 [Bacteroidota bacterium]
MHLVVALQDAFDVLSEVGVVFDDEYGGAALSGGGRLWSREGSRDLGIFL